MSTPYLWTPGVGPDFDAWMRLRRRARRPHSPMGEAWFLGESRRMFDLSGDLADMETEQLARALEEILSGHACFGPMREWEEWFHFILAEMAVFGHFEAGWRSALSEQMVSAFVALYPEGVQHPPYKGFRDDVLATLGRAPMHGNCWKDGRIVAGAVLKGMGDPLAGRGDWCEPSGDLSALLCFNLKYLTPAEIGPWLASVFAIADPHWRAQLLAVCVAAHPLLTGEASQPAELDETPPRLHWAGSNWLKGNYEGDSGRDKSHPPFLPAANREAALTSIRALMDEETLFDWQLAIAEIPGLEADMLDLPERFEAAYIRRS